MLLPPAPAPPLTPAPATEPSLPAMLAARAIFEPALPPPPVSLAEVDPGLEEQAPPASAKVRAEVWMRAVE